MSEQSITPELFSYEDVQALFINPQLEDKLLLFSPFGLQRIQKGDKRFYTRVDAAGNRYYYLSASSFAEKKKSKEAIEALKTWKEKLGQHISREYARVAAAYGTFMHIECAEILKQGGYDFGIDGINLNNKIADLFIQENIPHYVLHEVTQQAHNDLAAFINFIVTRNVRAVAIEMVLCSDKTGLAGALDFVCELDFDKSRVKAIVDMKFSLNIYETYIWQLEAYKDMYNDIFSDIFEVTHIFNWRPKDWTLANSEKGQCLYTLTNQTGKIEPSVLKHGFEEVKLKGWNKPFGGMKKLHGKVSLSDIHEGKSKFEDNLEFVHLDEQLDRILEKKKQKLLKQ